MASSISFVQLVVDQCAKAGEVMVRKMFGDYGVYCDGKIIGLISDNGFYLKPTEEVRPLLHTEVMRSPYEGAKPYFYIEEVDDREYLTQIVKATAAALPEPKPKKAKKG